MSIPSSVVRRFTVKQLSSKLILHCQVGVSQSLDHFPLRFVRSTINYAGRAWVGTWTRLARSGDRPDTKPWTALRLFMLGPLVDGDGRFALPGVVMLQVPTMDIRFRSRFNRTFQDPATTALRPLSVVSVILRTPEDTAQWVCPWSELHTENHGCPHHRRIHHPTGL